MIILPSVFKKWIKDDIERENTAYYNDTTPCNGRDNFERQGTPNVEHSCSNVRECSLFFENLNVRCSNVR